MPFSVLSFLFVFQQAQRQKDAKELASMRKHKDKAVHENQELTKQLKFSNETSKKVCLCRQSRRLM